jgi:hypothetical protein
MESKYDEFENDRAAVEAGYMDIKDFIKKWGCLFDSPTTFWLQKGNEKQEKIYEEKLIAYFIVFLAVAASILYIVSYFLRWN